MGMVEQFEHSNQLCVRREIEGCPVAVTYQTTTIRHRKKDYPAMVVRWKGRHLLELGAEKYHVDESVTTDAGPKLGVSLVFRYNSEVSCTEEERATSREEIRQKMEEIFDRRCLWKGERE